MYTCGFRINANLVKEGSFSMFSMNAKLVKEELTKQIFLKTKSGERETSTMTEMSLAVWFVRYELELGRDTYSYITSRYITTQMSDILATQMSNVCHSTHFKE